MWCAALQDLKTTSKDQLIQAAVDSFTSADMATRAAQELAQPLTWLQVFTCLSLVLLAASHVKSFLGYSWVSS